MNNNEANPSSLSRKDFKQALSKFSRADLIKLVGDLYSTVLIIATFLKRSFHLPPLILHPPLSLH